MGVSQYVLVLFNRNKFAQLITAVTLKVRRTNQAGLIPAQTGFLLPLLSENGNISRIQSLPRTCHLWLCLLPTHGEWEDCEIGVTGREFHKFHAQISWNAQAGSSRPGWERAVSLSKEKILHRIKWHLTFGFSCSNSATSFRIILHLHPH